ncbi:GntT/GntP/DsdX family permease [Kineobactrum salinum]|uniref:GntT/GntP/DsdX family permease n=1 Tax=Kineobactrum salinum TaxID=2708301 RepID=UPI001E32D1B7|nr:hypothetical protein [Kineobactrum salinum]
MLSHTLIAYLGLLGGLVLLIWLALRGVNIILAALLSSALVILTNGLPVAQGLGEYFAFGDLGAFTFAGRFFLLFAAGAMFGRVMGESHAASSIAMALVRKLGATRVLWITVLSAALLTYGGVVVFVVIFAMYPLGLKLLQNADVPKRLFCAALALGSGTFTLTALPGTPSIHNVISSVALGTDLFAGGSLGLLGGVIMLGLGMWYLERQRHAAAAAGEALSPLRLTARCRPTPASRVTRTGPSRCCRWRWYWAPSCCRACCSPLWGRAPRPGWAAPTTCCVSPTASR